MDETDLHVSAVRDLAEETRLVVVHYREAIQLFIAQNPKFQATLEPYAVPTSAPEIVRRMAAAAKRAGVGPMAAVAGAIAEFVGLELTAHSPEVIVENGGDIFIKSLVPRRIGIYAGASPLSGQLALTIRPDQTPLGVCSSSGTVGHSLSFGRADAAVVLAKDTALADAVATAAGNRLLRADDIEEALAFVKSVKGVTGGVVIVGDKIGMWGDVEIG